MMQKIIFILLVLLLNFNCEYKLDYSDDKMLCDLLIVMNEKDQRYRISDYLLMPLPSHISQTQQDSVWVLQKKLDDENTKELIAITKQRGWPDKTKLGCIGDMAPVVIFRHAPEKYFDDIAPIIEVEYTEKRMGVGDYLFIKNHIEGRPPMDVNELMRRVEMESNN